MMQGQKTNLKQPLTSFIGRQNDLAYLASCSKKKTRLLSILGPGGIGKTRLILQYASLLKEDYLKEGELWFCDLTEAKSLAGLLDCVSETLQVSLTSGCTTQDSIIQLGHALAGRDKKVLLILDNFESVVQYASETLGYWMTFAPNTSFFVTSRERLKLSGEVSFQLAPLTKEDARTLFLARAKTVQSKLSLFDGNKFLVEDIVDTLDRLPLAIELAAARLRVLSLPQLQKRLQERFEILVDTVGQSQHPRQSKMRNVIDWSWSLLLPYEQKALAQCSLFHGGFSLEAAEIILEVPQKENSPSVLEVLEALLDKSLLYRYTPKEFPCEIRLNMYESIREYAKEKLQQRNDLPTLWKRYKEFYLQRAKEWSLSLESSSQVESLLSLALEKENLWSIYQNAQEKPDPEIIIQVSLVLDRLFFLRGPTQVHLSLLSEAISHSKNVSPTLRIHVLCNRGEARRLYGFSKEAQQDLEEAHQEVFRIKDVLLQAKILRILGNLSVTQSKWEEAKHYFKESLSLLEAQKNPLEKGKVFLGLGMLSQYKHQYQNAEKYYQQSLLLFQKGKHILEEPNALVYLGSVCRLIGRYTESEDYLQQANLLQDQFPTQQRKSFILRHLGKLYQELGQYEYAEQYLQDSYRALKQGGYFRQECSSLSALGIFYHELRRYAEAEEYFQKALEKDQGEILYEKGIWLSNLALVYYEQGFWEKTQQLFEKALLRFKKAKTLHFQGIILSYQSALFADQGKIQTAQNIWKEAQAILEKLSDPFYLSILSIHKGHIDLAVAKYAYKTGDRLQGEPLEQNVTYLLQRLKSPHDFVSSFQKITTPHALQPGFRIAVRQFQNTYEATKLEIEKRKTFSTQQCTDKSSHINTLHVGTNGRWFQFDTGEVVKLERRRALRLLLKALSRTREEEPGKALGVHTLFQMGWPGEMMHPESGPRRVYVAMSTLRKLGLKEVLQRRDDGYLFNPAFPFARKESV